MRPLFLILLVILSFSIQAQDFWSREDSLNTSKVWVAGGVQGGAALITWGYLASGWYQDDWGNGWHWKDDANHWRGMDKLGHMAASYHLSWLCTESYEWAGMEPKKAAIIGSAAAFTYLGVVEVMDGFSSDWGFSLADLSANFLGSGLSLTQELLWHDQKIRMKFSYHESEYRALRPEIFGQGWPESLVKDYNGQTYWLSVSPWSFAGDDKWNWICVSFGYGGRSMITGDPNDPVVPIYPPTQPSSNLYLSMDIDLSRIRTKSKPLNALIDFFSYVKIPFPTLEWNTNTGAVYLHPIYK
jgi:hypothetical protein